MEREHIDVSELKKGKSKEQQKVIEYFLDNERCCFGNKVTDQEIDEIVRNKKNSINKQMVINKLGVEEEDVNIIPPVLFHGYIFKDSFVKQGKDDAYRTSRYQVSWLLFSKEQVYFYQNTYNLIDNAKDEKTEEYFYKDITSFSSMTNTETFPIYDKKGDKVQEGTLDTHKFALTVPGEKMFCALGTGEVYDDIIKGMKALLREKKNA